MIKDLDLGRLSAITMTLIIGSQEGQGQNARCDGDEADTAVMGSQARSAGGL